MGKVKSKKASILSRYYHDDQHVEDTPPPKNVYERHEPRQSIFEHHDTEDKLPCNIAETSSTSSGSAPKLMPLKPQPTYNVGQDLTKPDLEVTSMRFMNLATNPEVAEPSFVDPYSTLHSNAIGNNVSLVGNRQPYMYKNNIDAIHYVTNHLSNIEITRVQGIEPITASNGTYNPIYPNYTTPNHFPQITSRDQVLAINSSQNGNSQNQIKLQNEDSGQAVPTKANKRGKPTIPEDIKDVFLSAGFDEQKAADVVVYSNIDSFRENCSKISDKPELKERLKEVRRQGKNRNAAKKSRKNQLERMKNMREEFQRASKELRDKRKALERCQYFQRKYKYYCHLHKEWLQNYGKPRLDQCRESGYQG